MSSKPGLVGFIAAYAILPVSKMNLLNQPNSGFNIDKKNSTTGNNSKIQETISNGDKKNRETWDGGCEGDLNNCVSSCL